MRALCVSSSVSMCILCNHLRNGKKRKKKLIIYSFPIRKEIITFSTYEFFFRSFFFSLLLCRRCWCSFATSWHTLSRRDSSRLVSLSFSHVTRTRRSGRASISIRFISRKFVKLKCDSQFRRERGTHTHALTYTCTSDDFCWLRWTIFSFSLHFLIGRNAERKKNFK